VSEQPVSSCKKPGAKLYTGSTFDLEKELSTRGYGLIIGIDEAGRGPLAGPVVASAVALKSNCHCEEPAGDLPTGQAGAAIPGFLHESRDCHGRSAAELPRNDKCWDLVRDSKKLSHKQREKIFDFIQEHFWVGVGICDHHTIDRINILEATYLAAKMAVTDLLKKVAQETRGGKIMILFDGNKLIPNFSHEQRAIVGGDGIVKSISAASIVAKVTRDRIMLELHAQYPQYGLDGHKGYGTKLHMEMIQKHGPSPIHRQSFEPMRSLAKRRK
jgi:ribonuclease HII